MLGFTEVSVKYLTILIGILFLISCQRQPLRKISSEASQLDSLIEELSKNEPFYGNILVKKGDEIIVEKSFGLASLEWNIPNSPNSKFLLASVSKQFTAGAISTLVAKGKISYEDPLTKFFPESSVNEKCLDAFRKITIKDLLMHRAGLLKDPQADFVNLNKRYQLQELTAKILKDERLTSHTYGEFYYSNIGYTLLARIVEISSHFKFPMFVDFKVFRTLGLKDSGVFHRSKIIPSMTAGHYVDEDDKLSKYCCYDSSTNMGTHNLYSTARELSKWVDELTKDHTLIGKDHLDFKGIPSMENGIQYFNGFFRESTPYGNHYWHDGWSGGYASRVSFYPEKELTIIILLNRVNVFTAQNNIEAIHKVLREL